MPHFLTCSLGVLKFSNFLIMPLVFVSLLSIISPGVRFLTFFHERLDCCFHDLPKAASSHKRAFFVRFFESFVSPLCYFVVFLLTGHSFPFPSKSLVRLRSSSAEFLFSLFAHTPFSDSALVWGSTQHSKGKGKKGSMSPRFLHGRPVAGHIADCGGQSPAVAAA